MADKQFVLKSGRPLAVDSVGGNTPAAVLTTPFVARFDMQGFQGVIVQLNYTYGAATGLKFAFLEIDANFPSGSTITTLDVIAQTITDFAPSYPYPTLASGSKRFFFPISGSSVQMTVSGIGTPTSGDTITRMSITPAVFV